MKHLFLAFFVLISFPNQGRADQPQLSALQAEKLETAIQDVVEKAQQRHAFHGNIEVRLGEQVLFKQSLGVAIDEFDVPHTDKSRFMIASVTKSFTAALIMLLQDRGELSIEDKFSDHVSIDKTDLHPATQKLWETVTIRELLTHTSGTMRDVRFVNLYNSETYQPSLSAIFRDMAEGMNLFPAKRDGYAHYSNMGYLMLAYLVQTKTRMHFHDAIKVYILNPLGMHSSGQYHRKFNIKYLAAGYNYVDGFDDLRKRCCHDATSYVGSHSMYSDVTDLMLWIDDLFSENSKILSPRAIAEMTTASVPFKSRSEHYGYGLFVDKVNGMKRIWHDGFEPGYLSLISSIPEINLKIVVLGNRHLPEIYDGVSYAQILNNQISELVTESHFD